MAKLLIPNLVANDKINLNQGSYPLLFPRIVALAESFYESLGRKDFIPGLETSCSNISELFEANYGLDFREVLRLVSLKLTKINSASLFNDMGFQELRVVGRVVHYSESMEAGILLLSTDSHSKLGVVTLNLLEEKLTYYYDSEGETRSIVINKEEKYIN